jgi:hypothetical protein
VYYINECLLWLAFESFYYYSRNQLLALNIVLMGILGLHLVFKIMMTPRLPSTAFELLGKKTKVMLYAEHVLRYDFNLLHFLVYFTFLVSFFLPYASAEWVHLIYTARIIEVNALLTVVYTKIHTSKVWRVLYRLTMLTVIIEYLSHLFACIFYDLDQALIDSEYFGSPIDNPAGTSIPSQSTTSSMLSPTHPSKCFRNMNDTSWHTTLPTG